MAKTTKMDLFREEHQLIRVYGSKYFFAVAPVPRIDRVKFTVVELGSGGKDFIDIYLTTEEVRSFCADIDSGVAKKKIDADTGSYPTAYKWTRGENGAKNLVIGGGQKGVRVSAYDGTKNPAKRKQTLIQFSDLMELSFMFKLVYGLIPVQPNSYYDELCHAMVDNWNNYKNDNYNEAMEDASASDVAPVVDSVPDVQTPAATEGVVETITTISRDAVQEAKEMYGVPVVIQETGEKTNLVFTFEQASKLNWFGAYKKQVDAGKETTMKVQAYRKGRYYYFVDTAK